MKGYDTTEQFFYSVMYGNGIYEITEKEIFDPFRESLNTEEKTHILKNVITGELFFARRFLRKALPHYQNLIWNPPSVRDIVWPSDIIEWDGKNQLCTVFMEGAYPKKSQIEQNKKGEYALLFPYEGYIKHINLNYIKKEMDEEQEREINRALRDGIFDKLLQQMSWSDTNHMKKRWKLVTELAKAIYCLNKAGYWYYDFFVSPYYLHNQGKQQEWITYSPIFVAEDEHIFLNFSHLMFEEKKIDVLFEEDDIPIEFTLPEIGSGKRMIQKDDFTFWMQNYSLCAMIFYLLFNQYPYEDVISHIQEDIDRGSHYVKLQNYYYHNAEFILKEECFLEGIEEENRLYLQRQWEKLPWSMRQLFDQTLSSSNLQKEPSERYAPTPKEWLHYLKLTKQ